jgi:hypothetical protein
MKRVGIAVALVALALGGCGGPPPGTDGNLTNGWPAMPAAQVVVPDSGICYADAYGDFAKPLVTAAIGGKAVDCVTTDHDLETAYVGTFTGADAASPAPPADDSAALRDAYSTCETTATDYLGGDWRAALVWVSLVLPPISSWRVGARWFRCDIGHMASPVAGWGIIYTGSVKDGLRGSRLLAITCIATRESADQKILRADPIDCGTPHQAEFVGIYIAPDGPWPNNGQDLADAGCQKAVAHFLGFSSVAAWNNPTVGWWATAFDKPRWDIGDRSVHCFAYAYTKNKAFVGSVRGIGTTPARSA